MQLFKKIPFNHGTKDYDICIFFEENLVNILTFQNNHPANGFRYQVQIPKDIDMQDVLIEENFINFIDIAKTDIIDEHWEKFTRLFK